MPDARGVLPGPVVAVVGPTAVGKTALAETLALRAGGEVVSADSMQVYRGMDVGTAKPAPSDRRVAYHCLDLVDPGTPYSAALFQVAARSAIDGILARGALPVVAGGTGLYVRAALDRMEFPAGDGETAARARIEAELERIGPYALHERLAALDPGAAAMIHPNNSRRVVRALEILETQGLSYSDHAKRFSDREPYYRSVQIGLTMDRARLYERIDARVDAMIEAGLVEEVRGLLSAGFRGAMTATQAIGYKELVPVVEDGAPLAPAVAAIKQASRRYAKRQLTWFRADPRVMWLDVTELSPEATLEAAERLVESGL